MKSALQTIVKPPTVLFVVAGWVMLAALVVGLINLTSEPEVTPPADEGAFPDPGGDRLKRLAFTARTQSPPLAVDLDDLLFDYPQYRSGLVSVRGKVVGEPHDSSPHGCELWLSASGTTVPVWWWGSCETLPPRDADVDVTAIFIKPDWTPHDGTLTGMLALGVGRGASSLHVPWVVHLAAIVINVGGLVLVVSRAVQRVRARGVDAP